MANGRRARYAIAAILAGAGLFVSAFALADPPDGPIRDAIDRVEPYVPDSVRYRIHVFLGAIFELCPCTAAISAAQYEKASFHGPRILKPGSP